MKGSLNNEVHFNVYSFIPMYLQVDHNRKCLMYGDSLLEEWSSNSAKLRSLTLYFATENNSSENNLALAAQFQPELKAITISL